MKYVEKTRTWKDNWNDIIRDVLFQDEKLKELMLVPEKCTIVQFIEKYFVEDEVSDEPLTNEAVRITYYDSKGRDSGNKHIKNRYKEFDIYVKDTVLHTATADRLQNRYDLIAERLKYLLLKDEHICHMRFECEDAGYNLFTKTIGYKRFHIVFSYKTSV